MSSLLTTRETKMLLAKLMKERKGGQVTAVEARHYFIKKEISRKDAKRHKKAKGMTIVLLNNNLCFP